MMRRLRRLFVGLLALGGAMAMAPAAAWAAPFVVDDLDDAPDAVFDGSCDATGADTCTLRAALEEANDTVVNDDITFSVTGAHALNGAALFANGPVTITGNGQSGGTTIDANQGSQVLSVGGDAGVTVADLRIQGGETTDNQGAGIHSSAPTLRLNRVTVTRNTVNSVSGGFGGAGIRTATGSELELTDSTVSDNDITGLAGSGGGIRADGPVTLDRSTVSGNEATPLSSGQGGGLQLAGVGTHRITNSTISGNESGTGNGGGGLLAVGGTPLTIRNSTIAGNSTAGGGGGLRAATAVTLINALVAANSAAVGDGCAASLQSGSRNNVESPGASCAFGTSQTNKDNVSATDLKLGPLASNGGPTQTRALGAGSAALDFGHDATCAAAPVDGVDQRDVTRPRGPRCDVGAFELVPAPSGGGGGGTPPPAADNDSPETSLDSGPKSKVRTKKRKAKVTFGFSSEAGASFECSLDGDAFEPCTSPVTAKVKKGEHDFAVRATDVAGNVDQTPAEQSFKVKKKKKKKR